ncbi:hypothetical protein [Blautia sp. MSJ-19]|uniref:hypothetical protein n=1 Tax=Blautia sp. MSJ-19 TaxID=2841517 RepID=UPI001C0F3670|nr:hypothetical protein [Blautia sp. MSJ-19]MBU5482092.1 hypothetical protein [Blautia sp. MSJ-19]
MMKRLKKAEHRFFLSVLMGMVAGTLLIGYPTGTGQGNVLAWWGSIYPEFCFSEKVETGDDFGVEKNQTVQKPKISFWLAKAFERW